MYLLKDGVEENVRVYAKEQCSIQVGMGKNIPVQTNGEIKGDFLVKISDKTVTGLILPEIVYNVKKKLGCFFVENHNSDTLELKRGQTIGLATSCIVTQEELGQRPEKRKEDTSASQDRVMAWKLVQAALVKGTQRKQVGKQTVYSLKKTDCVMKLKKKSANLSMKVSSQI